MNSNHHSDEDMLPQDYICTEEATFKNIYPGQFLCKKFTDLDGTEERTLYFVKSKDDKNVYLQGIKPYMSVIPFSAHDLMYEQFMHIDAPLGIDREDYFLELKNKKTTIEIGRGGL